MEEGVIYEKTNVNADAVVSVEGASVKTLSNNQQIQSALSGLGFYNGPMDGNLTSDMCKKAITNFQTVYGLTANGIMNSSTQSKLDAASTMKSNVVVSSKFTNLTSSSKLNLDATEKQNFARTWAFLRVGLGCTTNQAAGICGNLYNESKFASDNAQDGKYPGDHNSGYQFKVDDQVGYGLEQWTVASVKKTLKDTATEMGLDVSDVNAQLATIRKEVTSTRISDWKKVFAKTSYKDVSDMFLDYIERPAKKNYEERRNFSKQIYEALNTF